MSWEKTGTLLPSLLERIGLNAETAAVFTVWDKEIGALRRGIEVVGVRRGVLYVRAKQALFFHELNLQKQGILCRINQHFCGKVVVRDIRRIQG